jgi:acyl-CoA synthetase (AMP-forming)/AMP-acid ligase II
MVGYHNNPKADEEAFFFRGGKKFFRTGDMGHLVDDKVRHLRKRFLNSRVDDVNSFFGSRDGLRSNLS